MRKPIFLALALVVPTIAATPVLAQDQNAQPSGQIAQSPIELRSGQVVDLINGELEAAIEEIFTPQFLAAVPPSQLSAISMQLSSQFGRAVAVEQVNPSNGVRAEIAIRMERAIAKGGIAIDPAQDHRISELLFQSFEPLDDGAEKILADLRALPGTTNALVAKLGQDGRLEPILAHNADTQLALGSTFKLYVLSALAHDIAAGRRDWDDVVQLSVKSFPSGQMQDWPQGAPVTLQTLATMMISISDNTATDQLIAVLGRERIEQELVAAQNSDPSRSIPFLTTRELFTIRGLGEEFSTRYRNADERARRAMLAELSQTAVAEDRIRAAFTGQTPGAIDIEWFASPEDLARLYARILSSGETTALDIMAVAPSMSDGQRASWQRAGFKGGSEPGVLNLTWLLTGRDGAHYIVTVGSNNADAPVAESTLRLIGSRMLALL